MGWRVVVISSRAKCDYKMGFMHVRTETEEKRIHLDDISVLILESTALSITAYLLSELTERKIKVIFCDNKRNPLAELIPCRGSYDSSGKLRAQINWSDDIKSRVWQKIIKEKIRNQAKVLRYFGEEYKANQLFMYADEVELGDVTNREGHAAKVYFSALFDEEFYRNSDDTRNAVLNYGYTVLLSAFNREIAANGYLTQLGIWHRGSENPFNLGSDLMEPARPLIDKFARECGFAQFSKNEKFAVVNLLNSKVKINDTNQYLNNALSIYTHSVFDAISENDESKIYFIDYEL